MSNSDFNNNISVGVKPQHGHLDSAAVLLIKTDEKQDGLTFTTSLLTVRTTQFNTGHTHTAIPYQMIYDSVFPNIRVIK